MTDNRSKAPASRLPHGDAAHEGSRQFWRQRLTSLALMPLSLFAVVLVVALSGRELETVAATLGRPIIALPLLVVLVITAWHMKIGMQEIIDDYVHGPAVKRAATLANAGFAIVVAGICAIALLRLGIGI